MADKQMIKPDDRDAVLTALLAKTPEGFIAERAEVFSVPTIERARLLGGRVVSERIPSVESAFKAG